MVSLSQVRQRARKLLFTKAQQQALFIDLAALIEDGVSLNVAIEMLLTVNEGVVREVVVSLLASLAQGDYLASALTQWIPLHLAEMIRAGEQSGGLAKSLRAAAASLSSKDKMVTALLGALSYPLAVLGLGLGVIVFINHSIFTDFQTLLPIAFWPSHAKWLVWFASGIQSTWWLFILFIVAFVVGAVFALRLYVGGYRHLLDTVPLVKLYREFVAARFMTTLSLLMANGLVLKNALTIMKVNATPYLFSHLQAMEHRLAAGFDSMGEVLDTGLINRSDILRLRLTIKDKRFESALQSLSEVAAQQGEKKVILSAKVLGGVLLFLSAVLAFLMIFSIYDVGSLLGKAG